METIHFFVKGHVQGVGFRHYVMKRAFALRLSGWVRNVRDGRVEVAARGEASHLIDLINACRNGSLFSSVSDIKIIPLSTVEPSILEGHFQQLPTIDA